MRKPYLDQSGDEISIHCLSIDDKQLLCDAVILLFEVIDKTEPMNIEAKQRIIHLKKTLDYD